MKRILLVLVNMSKRFVDNKNMQLLIKRDKSFLQRNYGLTTIRVIYGVLGVLLLLLLSIQAATGVMQADITKATVDNLAISIMFIAGALALASLFFICFILKFKNIIEISEFQSKLFASAMRDKSDYCILLTEREEVIYMDAFAQELFTDSIKNSYQDFALEEIFSGEKDNTKKEEFLQAIQNNEGYEVEHKVGDQAFLAVLEPLRFTEGFLLLRATSI